MPRLTLLSVLVLAAVCCCAQVTVTSQGTATTPGVAVPAPPASQPVLFAPLVHLGEGTADVSYSTQQAAQPANAQAGETQPFNFGVAQYESNASGGGVGQDINGKSLAEIAQEMKGRSNGTINARTFTNNDVDTMNRSGVNSNPSGNESWPGNNGVITPESEQPNAIAAPAPGPRSPFAPPENVSQEQLESAQAASQAVSPAGVEIAQNEQAPASAQEAANPPGTYSYPRANRLPQTATRLPLLGVLGLFTICAGIFVRYQRAR